MNMNEEHIFDELMRQKLGDYSETPDMELLRNIHFKKNRILSIYGLKRLLTVLIVAGSVLFGTVLLLKLSPETQTQKENPTNQIPVTKQIHSGSSTSNNSTSSASTNSTAGNNFIYNTFSKSEINNFKETNILLQPDPINNSFDILIKNIGVISRVSIGKQSESLQKEIKPTDKFSITGKVFEGTEPIEKGIVKLLYFDNETSEYRFFETTKTDASGEYHFNDVPTGSFLILAVSDNGKFLSTYLGNTTESKSAVDINISKNDDHEIAGMNINLIKGKLTSSQAESAYGLNSGSNSNSINNGSTYTGSSNFSSSSGFNQDINTHPSGNSYADVPAGNIPYSTIQTMATNQIIVPNTPLTANTIKNPKNYITGPNTNIVFNSTLNLYPNPATYSVNFDIATSENVNADIRILSSNGNIVYHKASPCKSGDNTFTIDITTFKPGDYYVVVNLEGKQILTGRLTKQTDTFR